MAAYKLIEGGKEDSAPDLEQLTDPSVALPGEAEVSLTEDQKQALGRQLEEVLQQYFGQLAQRHKRYQQLEDAFNLEPDPNTSGQAANSSQLATELTRTHVTTAHSRISEQILGLTDPWVVVEPINGDSLEPADQKAALATTKAVTDFIHAYNRDRVNTDLVLDDACGTLSLLGNSIVRQDWIRKKRKRRFRDKKGQWATTTDDLSGIEAKNLHPENFICWPMTVQKVKNGLVVGHRDKLTEGEFRLLCGQWKIPAKVRDEMLKEHKEQIEEAADQARIADVHQGQSPLPLIEVYELWCRTPLPEAEPDEDPLVESAGYVVLMLREPLKILKCIEFPHNCGRHPYFNFPYWRLPGTWLADGVGASLLFRQKASDALQNMLVDHLRVAVHHLRIIKEGSSLWEQIKDLVPGRAVASESPQDDIRIEPLGGGEVEMIIQAQERNDIKAMEASKITAVVQGRGDPTLKSGASPSSLQLLLAESGKEFGKIDRNIREELDEFFWFQLELIQQYGAPKLYYDYLPEASAGRMIEQKILKRPEGDMRRKWAITVRAPSAETNREVKNTQLTIFYNLTVQHLQLLLQTAQQVWGQTDKARLQRVMEESLVFLHAVYRQLKDYAQIGPIGANPPDIEPKPIDETINNLLQYAEQLQQAIQQKDQQLAEIQAQMGDMPQEAPGGSPMAGMV